MELDYFSNIDGKLLPALVDRKLMDVMPDLIHMDHVHINPCMLIIHYCILWQGLSFHNGSPSNSIDNHYARQVFIYQSPQLHAKILYSTSKKRI